MSDECRCDDLNELRPRLRSIQQAYDKVFSQEDILNDCLEKIANIAVLQQKTYSADNCYEVKSSIDQIHRKLELGISEVRASIGALKSQMEDRERCLSNEDHNYHEEQKRREAADAEERRKAAMAQKLIY